MHSLVGIPAEASSTKDVPSNPKSFGTVVPESERPGSLNGRNDLQQLVHLISTVERFQQLLSVRLLSIEAFIEAIKDLSVPLENRASVLVSDRLVGHIATSQLEDRAEQRKGSHR